MCFWSIGTHLLSFKLDGFGDCQQDCQQRASLEEREAGVEKGGKGAFNKNLQVVEKKVIK